MNQDTLHRDEIGYAIAKQLSTAYELQTKYGALRLTSDMRNVVEATLRPMMLRMWREAAAPEPATGPMCMLDFMDAVRTDLLSRPEVLVAINDLIEKAGRIMTEKCPADIDPDRRAMLIPRLADKLADDLRRMAYPDGRASQRRR